MEEMISGIVANMLTLVLTIPTVLVFGSWLKSEEMNNCSKNQKVIVNDTMCPVDMDILRKQFVTYMIKASLTEREIEVAWLIYRGYTNLQIAEELFVSETTVKKHATHIYEKLKVSGRKELKELKDITKPCT
jgi:ATP/maltotriose-dependent transcriptional regulator MalT